MPETLFLNEQEEAALDRAWAGLQWPAPVKESAVPNKGQPGHFHDSQTGKPVAAPGGETGTDENHPAIVEKAQGLVGRAIAGIKGAFAKLGAAIDDELNGGASTILGGVKSASPAMIREGIGQAVTSSIQCVHEEVFEAAMAQASFGGAHMAGVVGAKVLAAGQVALLKAAAGVLRKMGLRESASQVEEILRLLEGMQLQEGSPVENKGQPGHWHDSETGHPVPAPQSSNSGQQVLQSGTDERTVSPEATGGKKMDTKEEIDEIAVLTAPGKIKPVHEIRDEERFNRLVDSMRKNGWQGRPILALETGDDEYQGWTGSHRLPAAQEAGLDEIPTVIISWDDFQKAADAQGRDVFDALDHLYDDQDKIKFLDDGGLHIQAELMREEETENLKDGRW